MDTKSIRVLKEIGLCTQYMIPIPNSMTNNFLNYFGGGGQCDHLMSMRIFALIMNKIFI